MKLSPLAALGHEILAINKANGWNVTAPEDPNENVNPYKKHGGKKV